MLPIFFTLKGKLMVNSVTSRCPKALVVCVVLCWFGCASDLFPAQPLHEFAYRDVQIALLSFEGRAVAGASIYGYCPDFNLIWPTTDREDTKNDPRQHHFLWKEAYLGKTGRDGMIAARVPPGRWSFFACARWPNTEKNSRIVAAWSEYVEPQPGSQIVIRPSVKKSWSFQASNTRPLTHKRFFLKPDHLPIWVPVDAPMLPRVTFEISKKGQLDVWSEGDGDQKNPAFALHWGKLCSETSTKNCSPVEDGAVLNVTGGQGQTSLSWLFRGAYGLTGRMHPKGTGSILLSPGKYGSPSGITGS